MWDSVRVLVVCGMCVGGTFGKARLGVGWNL